MRAVTTDMTAAWLAEEKVGAKAPVFRATIQRSHMRLYPYDTADAPGGDYGTDRDRRGKFATYLFCSSNDDPVIREIKGIIGYTSTSSLEQDVDEATLTIFNSDITPIGEIAEDSEDYDLPGAFTFSRGNPTVVANRWDHNSTGWDEWIAPDRVVRVFAGYGSDNTLAPAMDPNLSLRGTWMIDTVDISTDGTITLKMRSLGRLLLDHISFPPVVPWEDYPLTWSTIHNEQVPGRAPTGGNWLTPAGTATSSNEAYVNDLGLSSWSPKLTDTPRYVGRWGGVQGHNDHDPLFDDPNRYWLSTGQESRKSFVWWQYDFNTAKDVAALKLRPLGGPYKVFISIHDGTGWVGKRKIPYQVTTGDIDNGSRINYTHAEILDHGLLTELVLPRVYHSVHKIRLTFTRLREMDGGYPWRAGLRRFDAYTGSGLGFTDTGTITKAVGNYRDWTDVVKWVCAWAGLWWPFAHGHNVLPWSNDDLIHYDYDESDRVFPYGRVWGTFQPTGTAGIADATPDNFDKQPLMDVINYVRNIVGFFFRVDECGSVVWRMPNLYSLGNWVTPGHLDLHRKPTYDPDALITIDENNALIDYTTTMDSTNLRELLFVANSNGKFGTVVKGYAPYHTGLRRAAGWTDEHFSSNRECRVAADMVSAQEMFSWRTASITMPAHPALQIDDQVRIYERVTNETFYHYVTGIEESYDYSTGEWLQHVSSHWLGERPSDAWVVRVDQLDGMTQQFLDNLGAVE